MPKQDHYMDYEQPQAQYPEEMPPMVISPWSSTKELTPEIVVRVLTTDE